MSYRAAKNSYSQFEADVNRILKTESVDFFKDQNISGIFGVSTEWGLLYCDQICLEFPDYKDAIYNGLYESKIKEFIKLGNQTSFFSDKLNTEMTANTARYIYHALLIHKYCIEKFNSNLFDIIEIGGGYGGLCYWLRTFCSSISNYTILDLPAPSLLQKKCLSFLNTKCYTISDLNFFKASRPVFVISNYGYSEFNEFYQMLYKQEVIDEASGGFMIWNNWTGIFPFTDLPMRVENERPEFPDCPNKFIYF